MRVGNRQRLPNSVIGLVMVVVLAIASYLAFTKEIPWAAKYEVQAVFESAGNIRVDSPVRIAGVNVGKVTGVEHLDSGASPDLLQVQAGDDPPATDFVPETASVVTMQLEDSALPLRTDATMKLRPRLFLEGNLFVDVKPGSPNAETVDQDYTFPASQTSIAVQLDQVLTTLQSDVRSDLQILLDQFGNALTKYGGAKGFRELYRSSPGAFRYTSQVNQALLGTSPNDLSDLIVNLDSTVDALGRDEGALQDLVTNLRIVTGSFAAQDAELERAIGILPDVLREGEPALASLNRAFPSVRAFAREALPGTLSTPATLDALTPFLGQVRGLVSRPELRGLVGDLRPTIPKLTKLTRRTIPFLRQGRALSSCFNEVVIPWSQDTVPDPDIPASGKVFEELGYGLVGISGESRSGDGNGSYIRVLGAGGLNTVVFPDQFNEGGPVDGVGTTLLPIEGARPAIQSSLKTPFRPDVACETNEPPNLDSGAAGAPPMQSQSPQAAPQADGATLARATELQEAMADALKTLSKPDISRARALAADEVRTESSDDYQRLLAQAYGFESLLDLLPEGDSK